MIVDLFEFPRRQQEANGEIRLSALTRIDMPERPGALRWTLRGSMAGRRGAPRVDLTVAGDVLLVCQRCLRPMTQPVSIETRLLVAADEEAAEALDQDDTYDVVVGSAEFDLDALIEDEVILALPSAPRHRTCPEPVDADARATKPSPFAALAALKPALRRDDDAPGGE